jgi:hypothetical protein
MTRTSSHGRRRLPPALLLCASLALAACTTEPLEWVERGGEPARLDAPPAADARLALAADGSAALAPAPLPPTPWTPPALCEGSARYAAATAAEWYATGWLARADGSALLAAARSDDGGRTWNATVPVDSLDRSRARCARPAPAVAADSASGYVHVAYFMDAPEGAGVFFSHSMDGGALFHEPVPIIYGTRPVPTAVAAWRDTVAVAYEDPNGDARRVGLALSRTMGHIFEDRLPLVSGRTATATAPRVALRDGLLAVAWRESAPGAPASGEAALRVRLARWR